MDADLLAKLDEYLGGCPDPTGKPWWVVKRSSRLLWECRERLRALSPPASAAVVPDGFTDIERRMILNGAHMANERAREKGDHWDRFGDLLARIARSTPSPPVGEKGEG